MELAGCDLVIKRAGRTVVNGLSITCPSGALTVLVGPSGSGKTTALNCLGLLLPPDGGRVLVDGRNATDWKKHAVRDWWRRDVAFIYQDYGVIEDRDVGYNVTLRASLFGKSRVNAKALDVLADVGLAERVRDRAMVLSGGEKQRLGIARALYKDAKVVLADEPTASLDSGNRQAVTDMLRLAADRGACVIIATHDERLAAQADVVCDLAKPTQCR